MSGRRHEHFDIVVVGGGAAGAVLAARLSERPELSVLLLEAGEHRRSPLLMIPAAETVLMGNPSYDWGFRTEPDPSLGGRQLSIPRGRALGGSNSINGMIFVRGQRGDYDEWAAQGNSGWSWNEVLPYFRKLETAQGVGDPTIRGVDGPITVGLPRERNELCDAFLAAAVARGHALNPDYNSGDQEGFGYYQVNHDRGRRSGVVGTYLKVARERPNLTIRTGARVVSLQMAGTRCTGVTYVRAGASVTVEASSEVILSAGTIQSPQLLELSGIGSPTVLAAAGIPVRHDLPGVGENFRDHFAARLRWRVSRPITFNERSRGTALAAEILRYAVARRGLLSLPIALGFGFVKSDVHVADPDLQFHFAPASYADGASSRRLDTRPGMTLGVYPLRPDATGSVHIRSDEAFAAPQIRTAFLSERADLEKLIAGMRIARDIMAAPELAPLLEHETLPGSSADTDSDLAEYVRTSGDTSYHPVGTCRMGGDDGAVVDERLRVRGLEGLRVIDASIMPTLVSGNTNAASLMIGEKGAELILESQGLTAETAA